MRQETGIISAEIDTSVVGVSRRSFVVAGHFARPDIFELRVNRKPQNPISLD